MASLPSTHGFCLAVAACAVLCLTGSATAHPPGKQHLGSPAVVPAITTVAGTGAVFPEPGAFSGDGGPARRARMIRPGMIAPDGKGGYYTLEDGRIRRISRTGIIRTVAGNGSRGFCGEGGPALSACFRAAHSFWPDGRGGLYVADTFNHRIRHVDRRGTIDTVVGTGEECVPAQSACGIDGPADRARLSLPVSVRPDRDGSWLIGEANAHRVTRYDPHSGLLTLVAGTGRRGFSGDGGPAVAAELNTVADAVPYRGGVLIADGRNCRLRWVDPHGTIHPFAGGGLAPAECFRAAETFAAPLPKAAVGDGGPARAAKILIPGYIAIDGATVYVTDFLGNTVRRIRDGRIDTVAGSYAAAGFSGDGASPSRARLAWPSAVCVMNSHTLLVTDTGNNRIRKVTLSA